MTSRIRPMEASRAGVDSSLNGLSGESGSAALTKNWVPKRWYGSATSSQVSRTVLSRALKSRSPSIDWRAVVRCTLAISS